MKKIELEEKIERKKRFTLLSSLVIVITLVLALFQLMLSNHLASFGKELMAFSKEEQELSYKNELLTKKIAEQTSITAILGKAEKLSFYSASNVLLIDNSESVALLHNALQ